MRYHLDMQRIWAAWRFPLLIFFLTCFAVFYLPFLLPPPVLQGVSAANAAGFNNKVAAVSTALLGLIVFLVSLRRPAPTAEIVPNEGVLPRSLVVLVMAVIGGFYASLGLVMLAAHFRFVDHSYFVDQISKYIDYHRQLYVQIEFPYGPLLFYGPVLVHALLSPLHASLDVSYFVTLLLEQAIGFLLLAYLIDRLPISRTIKSCMFIALAFASCLLGLGLNYTLFRFAPSPAMLILAGRQKRPVPFALCLFVGQVLSLGLSAELGFAFGAASLAWGGYAAWTRRRAWMLAAAAPLLATAAFLVIAGPGYLKMLELFSKGIYALIVEPVPYILVFLFAVIWLVPRMLAREFRQQSPEAPMHAALYVFGVALLPVAFGRADPAHVLYNEFVIYLLSMVAVGTFLPRTRLAWVTAVAAICFFTFLVNVRVYYRPLLQVVYEEFVFLAHDQQPPHVYSFLETHSRRLATSFDHLTGPNQPIWAKPFDLQALDRITGGEPVATPLQTVTPRTLDALKASGQYVPSFYDFQIAVLDDSAEHRQTTEFNEARWALIPKLPDADVQTEVPEQIGRFLGSCLVYHRKHEPYSAGEGFMQNLRTNWQPAGEVGDYVVYRRK